MNSQGFVREDNQIKLTGALNFTSVPNLQKQLKKLLPTEPAWIIDLAGVTFSDSSGLALLAECVRMSHKYNFSIGFQSMPEQMCAMAKVTGLQDILNLGADRG